MAVRNVTIDDADTSGIITYTNSRISGWADQTCNTCFAKPIDLSQVFDGTWHDTTHMTGDSPLSAQFTFTGSAIYVYGIQVNSTSGIPIVNNSLVFTLDGEPAGTYSHTPNDPDYAYNVKFYANDQLPFGPHNLTMEVNATSMVLFDYIVYTTNSSAPAAAPTGGFSSPKQGSSNHAGAIAGGVIGGFAGLLILIVVIWALFFRRRRGGVSMVHQVPVSKTEEDSPQRPAMGILSRFHGNGSDPTVEPFTYTAEQQTPANWGGGKGGAVTQQRHPSIVSGASGSRVQPPSSVDPPSTLPSSHVAVSAGSLRSPQSPEFVTHPSALSSSGLHSPAPSQTVSTIVPNTTSSSVTSADAGHSDLERGKRAMSETIAEEREEAPPAYVTAT